MQHATEFFTDLKEWSARKLNIIKKYVDGFSRILGSKSNSLYYVDGFAGKGIYDDGEKGSPVLVAEFSEELRRKGEAHILYTVNVEKDPGIYSNLCTETSRFGKYVENFPGSFNEKIDSVLSATKGDPAIFFIDPFGVKGTNWTSIKKILLRKESTDVWMRFDHKTILRLCGFYSSDTKAAQSKLATLQNAFGIADMNYLQSRLGCSNTPEERIEDAVYLYTELLEKEYAQLGKQGFAAAYPIISLDGQKKYHLIFSCAHPKAAILASDIVNGIEETFQREKEEYQAHQSGQMRLFSSEITAEQVFEEKVSKLKNLILKLPKDEPKKRAGLHYEILVRNRSWFGKIRGKHLTQALKEMLAECPKNISCKGTPGNNDSVITIE